jgi:prophage regulatory protein
VFRAVPERFTFHQGKRNMAEQTNSVPTILRRKQVESRVGLSRSTIYDAVKAGTFPKPIQLGPRSVGWLESDVAAWLEQRIAQSRTPAEQQGARR